METSSSRLTSALAFAESLHIAQTRKGTDIPYLSHLLAVASLVMESGGATDEIIAALLHDSIEDQGNEYPGGRQALRDKIGRDFGETVLHIVMECTDDEGHDKGKGPDEAAAWRHRKEQYIQHLRHTDNQAVLRVSCADKLHNARSLLSDYRRDGESVWKRFRTQSGADQIWCYRQLSNVFLEKNADLAGDLKWTIDQLAAHMAKNSAKS